MSCEAMKIRKVEQGVKMVSESSNNFTMKIRNVNPNFQHNYKWRVREKLSDLTSRELGNVHKLEELDLGVPSPHILDLDVRRSSDSKLVYGRPDRVLYAREITELLFFNTGLRFFFFQPSPCQEDGLMEFFL